jgi:hypothetical protein
VRCYLNGKERGLRPALTGEELRWRGLDENRRGRASSNSEVRTTGVG